MTEQVESHLPAFFTGTAPKGILLPDHDLPLDAIGSRFDGAATVRDLN
jgi:hypothetical protein